MNEDCILNVFVELDGEKIETFPSKTIPFDTTEIPENIVNLLKEAIVCYSNQCFIASAIMVRRTLEEICLVENIDGGNLHQKLENLKTKASLSIALNEAMFELKLLGNDAAHVELKHFDEIGKEETSIAIKITQEILKSLYQNKALVDEIRSLKKSE